MIESGVERVVLEECENWRGVMGNELVELGDRKIRDWCMVKCMIGVKG